MSITAYVGLPGAGKSYSVVENVIIPALREGRNVATNIPMNHDQISADIPNHNLIQIEVPEGGKYSDIWAKLPPGAVIVIDEVWRVWPQGLRADKADPRDSAFLAEHRHMVGEDGNSTEIILVVQDLGNISAFVTRLVEKTYVATKLDFVGATKKYKIDVYQGPHKGPQYPSNPLRTIHGTYKPHVYQYYKSHTKSSTGLAGTETKTDKRYTIWGNYLLMVGIPIAIVLIIWGSYAIVKYFKPVTNDTTAKTEPITKPPLTKTIIPEPNIIPEKPQPKTPSLSTLWRITGEMSDGQNHYIYMTSNEGMHRRISYSSCQQHDEIRCDVDNSMVTRYSGRPSRDVIKTALSSTEAPGGSARPPGASVELGK